MFELSEAAANSPRTLIPAPAEITTAVRAVDDRLWALLTRPGPLSADEWSYIEERERMEEGQAASW